MIGQGAPPAVESERRDKLNELSKIELTIKLRRGEIVGPRRGLALCAGFVVAVAALFGLSEIPNLSLWATKGAPFALGLLVFLLTLRFSSKPWTYTSMLKGQLAALNAQHVDVFVPGEVEQWLEDERHLILTPSTRTPDEI